jgi:hypothetical protein
MTMNLPDRPGRAWIRRLVLTCGALGALGACGGTKAGPPDEVDAAAVGIIDAAELPDASCAATSSCPPASCGDLRLSGACPEHRVCQDLATGGVCQDACDPDYLFNPSTGVCDSCSVVQCGPAPTCDVGVPGSIADLCTAQHRACSAENAACGACLPEFTFDMTTATCLRDCSTTTCAPGNHVELQGDACACMPNVCPTGEAAIQGVDPFQCTGTGGAAACNLHCSIAQGETGVYQVTTQGGACVCATDPGYYWSSTQRAGRLCDADHDGWINRSAWNAYNNSDPTLSAIAQAGCELQRVDRVKLVNEYGQEKVLYVCGNGFAEAECTAADGGWSWLPLVEPDGNDSQAVVDMTPMVTPAPGGAPNRRLFARELNAVTKACVSVNADFDGDTHADVAESQVIRSSNDRADRWSQVAYFVELHTGEYQPPMGAETAGTFVITERSRCDARFPMGYAPGAGGYWRECARQRDARYVEQVDAPGFDFAQWTDRGAPIVAPPPLTSSPAKGAPPAAHGLCSIAPPWAGAWRGMTHASQFKCVVVDDAAAPPLFAVPTAAFDATGYLDFQQCKAQTSAFGAPPSFACTGDPAPAAAQVGWAAIRYEDGSIAPGQPALHDVAGCVDETIWRGATPSICPDGTPRDADGLYAETADPANFGNLVCACDPRDPTRHPGLPDPIDDGAWDADCDGVDGQADKMVFVAIDGHDDSTCGTRESPCQTINYGIGIATPGRPDVAVSDGTYYERVQLKEGINLHGGYSRSNNWVRNDTFVAHIQGGAESVYAENLQAATVDRFAIYTPSAGGAGNSVYGVRLVNAHVTLRHLTVTTGSASAGSRGGDGAGGAHGRDGDDASGRSHGAGGADQCGSWPSAGFPGGDGGYDGISWACGTGSTGGGASGGGWCGGGGGGGSPSCSNGGAPGSPGADATCANPPIQNGSTGGLSSNLWSADVGANGTAGRHGFGGSGGGGGGAGDAAAFGNGGNGGGGGGGGSGGCGGAGAQGGRGGGAAIALLAVDSPGVTIEDCVFTAGTGGRGGDGGTAGGGGAPGGGGRGAGGSGGSGSSQSGAGSGANGGAGGWGGAGGGGQGGPGGPSVGVMLCRSTFDGTPTASAAGGGDGGGGGWPNYIGGAKGTTVSTYTGCDSPHL